MSRSGTIIKINDGLVDEAVDVLTEAFEFYPVFEFVLPQGTERRRHKLQALVYFYLMTRHLRRRPVYAVQENGKLQAVVLANPPGPAAPMPELSALEKQLLHILGTEAEQRRLKYENASDDGEPRQPHFFIGMIGTRASARGKGYGRRLIEKIADISASHPVSQGVALSTEDEENVKFYERLGFSITLETVVGPLRTWAMWRPDNK